MAIACTSANEMLFSLHPLQFYNHHNENFPPKPSFEGVLNWLLGKPSTVNNSLVSLNTLKMKIASRIYSSILGQPKSRSK
jgi:hypothetical protein